MYSNQIQDIALMYDAVYDSELREHAEEYNRIITNEDISEIAAEYFYTHGLNSHGVNILAENIGVDNFIQFVYEISENTIVFTEERSARRRPRRPGDPTYQEMMEEIGRRDIKNAEKRREKREAIKAAKQAANQYAQEDEKNKSTESENPISIAKQQQPKVRSTKDNIARGILAIIDRGGKDLGQLRQYFNTAREAGRDAERKVAGTLGTIAGGVHGAANVAHRAGMEFGKSGVGKKIKSTLGLREEFESWINCLVEGGYDLSEYTWGDLYEYYVNETVNRYDSFDCILEYLISNGYADGADNAVAIMANMSEEWRQNIIETQLTPSELDHIARQAVADTLNLPPPNKKRRPKKLPSEMKE